MLRSENEADGALFPANPDRVFGENMRGRRVALGLSQSLLAKKISERGFSFHQPTVQRIEDAERPVKLAEAIAIAAVLETTVEGMLQDRSVRETRRYLVELLEKRVLSISLIRAFVPDVAERNLELLHLACQDYVSACQQRGVQVDEELVTRAMSQVNALPDLLVPVMEAHQAAVDAAEKIDGSA